MSTRFCFSSLFSEDFLDQRFVDGERLVVGQTEIRHARYERQESSDDPKEGEESRTLEDVLLNQVSLRVVVVHEANVVVSELII